MVQEEGEEGGGAGAEEGGSGVALTEGDGGMWGRKLPVARW